MPTKVVFRKFRDQGDVIALFPEIDQTMCMSYQHIGQHGGADYNRLVAGWDGLTVPATPEEYAPLLAELRAIGYTDLVVRTRYVRRRGG